MKRKEKRHHKGTIDTDLDVSFDSLDKDVSFKDVDKDRVPTNRLFKSPSNTTLYSPGLRKISSNDVTLIKKISNFVESIRLDEGKGGQYNQITPTTSRDNCDIRRILHRDASQDKSTSGEMNRRDSQSSGQIHSSHDRSRVNEVDHDHTSDQLLIETEKFRAKVEAPKGINSYNDMIMPYDYQKLKERFVKPEGLARLDSKILFLRNFNQDDEFLHVTSQIEPSLRVKIERGEFVELERLLPQDRSSGSRGDDLNRQLFQLITQGTNSYLEQPTPKTGKINSIIKWDQAFRVFAAIYTNANPERASEIGQYVYVIHTAAVANPWDNVYYYDINFCELMASKPWRS